MSVVRGRVSHDVGSVAWFVAIQSDEGSTRTNTRWQQGISAWSARCSAAPTAASN